MIYHLMVHNLWTNVCVIMFVLRPVGTEFVVISGNRPRTISARGLMPWMFGIMGLDMTDVIIMQIIL